MFQLIEMAASRWPELRWAYAVPNGGHRNVIVARKLKAEGVRRGVPDVVVPIVIERAGRLVPGMYVELKRVRGGRVSPEQAAYREFLVSQGYEVVIARGANEAWAAIRGYLEAGRIVSRRAAA